MPRAILASLLFSLLALSPLALSASDLDPAKIARATTLTQISHLIREHAPRQAAQLSDLPGIIIEAAETYGLDPFILAGLLRTESGFDRRAISSAGAIGLPQFLPATILMHKVSLAEYRSSVRVQVNLAARYLRDLTLRYGGRQDLALLAYHGSLLPSQARYVMRVRKLGQ